MIAVYYDFYAIDMLWLVILWGVYLGWQGILENYLEPDLYLEDDGWLLLTRNGLVM